MYDLVQTPQYRKDFNDLDASSKRIIQETLETLKQSPTQFKDLIHCLSKRPKEIYYRMRVPGAYVYYLIPTGTTQVMLTAIRTMRKGKIKTTAVSTAAYF